MPQEELDDDDFADFVITLKYLASGGLAGAASRTIVSPLERTKIIYQVHYYGDKKTPSLASFLMETSKKTGFKSLFKGNLTSVLRIIPYSAVQFVSYEYFKKLISTDEDTEHHLYTLTRLCAGAMAGIASATVTYPLDLVRTRLSADLTPGKGRYRGIIDCAKQCYTTDTGMKGMRGSNLFKGLSPTLMGIAPYVGLNFACFESLKSVYMSINNLQPEIDEIPVVPRLVCGGVAGAISQTLTYPLDLVRHRMQMSNCEGTNFKYKASAQVIGDVYRNEGVKGFYRGMFVNLLKVVPSISVSFVVYEFCIKILLAS